MLFFEEVPPPHTSENSRNRFEDELDWCNVHSFIVITSNMKCAFIILDEDIQVLACANDDMSTEDDDDDLDMEQLQFWTPKPLHFEGWIGCACHQLQISDSQWILNYRRVQSVFHKAKLICALSRKSRHFSYSRTARIPVPN